MRFLIWNLNFFMFLFYISDNEIISALKFQNATDINLENIRYRKDSTITENNSSKFGIVLNKSESKYTLTLDSILLKREELRLFYQNSENKSFALDSVRNYLLNVLINKVLPYWYGTSWAMSGVTQIPQEGFVGCSYFVANTLNAVGFNFDRVGVARASSRNIARTFQLSENVVLLKGYTNEQVISYLKENYKEGLYIVGLDYHVAYMLYSHNEVFIIHSGKQPSKVVIEFADCSPGFYSNLHYIGEITSNDELIIKWLYNEYIPKIEIFEFS